MTAPDRVEIASSRHHYAALIGRGVLDQAGHRLRAECPALGRRALIVTDSHVGPLYGGRTAAALREAGYDAAIATIPAGEASKSMAGAEDVAEQLASAGIDRHGFVVALGGGVVGDLAGFVAAIYQRGIPVVQIPTTIVSQVDSSVGGKTGVNLRAGKNLAGSFHPPAFVLVDVATLDTLPPREFREGFAEVIKHGVIADRPLVGELADAATPLDLVALIRRNIEIKAAIVKADEFERTGLRARLNFGHTVGHAIESVAGYGAYLHGEAIAMGMAVAARLSRTKSALPVADEALMLAALKRFELPGRIPATLETSALLAALQQDKKFVEGSIRFVLTRGLGSAFVSAEVTEGEIAEAIESVR